MNVTLKIDNDGMAKGTLGWLAHNADTIHVGQTKNGKRGAWLRDPEGNTITVLAIEDYMELGDGEIHTAVQRDPSCVGALLCADILFTDAAWVAMTKIIAIAVDAMTDPMRDVEISVEE